MSVDTKVPVVGKGGITATVVADSTHEGNRITTLQLRYPRFIHSELMTHRMFSRGASSSRAVPINKTIEQVRDDPAMPIHWGKNKAGMQASEQIEGTDPADLWYYCANTACEGAVNLQAIGLHKQVVNRVLEPYQFIHVILTATEWDNFFALRLHPDAQPEMQELAKVIKIAMKQALPNFIPVDGWHLPYISSDELAGLGFIVDEATLCNVSAARCARVSYLNHDNSNPNIDKDLELARKLEESGHLSPFEHQATPMEFPRLTSGVVEEGGKISFSLDDGTTHIDRNQNAWSGNFRGFVQYRQLIFGEYFG